MFVIQDVNEQVAKLAGEALASLRRRRLEIDDRVAIDATMMATAALCSCPAGGDSRVAVDV
jgi:hypothetical protein